MNEEKNKENYQDYFSKNNLSDEHYFEELYQKNNQNNEAERLLFKKVSQERRIAISVLGLFAVFVIIISFMHFNHAIKDPLSYKGKLPEGFSGQATNNNSTCLSGNCQNNDLSVNNLDLRLIDTDGDGVSDWDELFVYGTSPYLSDTDGDGLTDYEELFVYNTDPLCPEGETCGGALINPESQEKPFDNDLYNYLASLDEEESFSTEKVNYEDLPPELQPDQISPETLREMLLEIGFEKQDLDQFSDANLLEIYQEIISGL